MSRTVAVAMCRDELDVVEGWARHLADEADHILIADNLSSDGTREILDQLAKELPLTVVDDDEPGYEQSRKTSALAERAAREHGATWVCPIDLDELWFSAEGRIREVLAQQPEWVSTIRVPLFNHLRTALDVDDPDPFRSMVWRQPAAGALPKVAFRWQEGAVVAQGNHDVWLPAPGDAQAGLEIRHFPIRSAAHMIRKARNGAAAYAAAPDLPADHGAHWKAWGQILDGYGEAGIRAAYTEHWHHLSPVDAGLVEAPAPYLRWQG